MCCVCGDVIANLDNTTVGLYTSLGSDTLDGLVAQWVTFLSHANFPLPEQHSCISHSMTAHTLLSSGTILVTTLLCVYPFNATR